MKFLFLFLSIVVFVDAFMMPIRVPFRSRIMMKGPLAEAPLISVEILNDAPEVDKSEVSSVVVDKVEVPSNVVDESEGSSNVVDKSEGSSNVVDESEGSSNVVVVVDESEEPFANTGNMQEGILVIDERDAAIVSLQETIQLKDIQYEELMVQLKEDMKVQENSFQNRISDFISQLEAVKINASEERMALVQTHVAKEASLRADIDILLSERLALEQQLADLRERYTTDCIEWEDRFEAEQDKRVKEERALSQAMETLQLSHKDELKEIMYEKQQTVAQIQRDMNNRLIEKESTLQNVVGVLKETKVELVAMGEYTQQLEQERSSLRQMAKLGWKVVKSRVTNRWKKLRGS